MRLRSMCMVQGRTDGQVMDYLHEMMLKVLSVLCGSLVVLGCDVPGQLVIKNRSGSEAKVRFYPRDEAIAPFTLGLAASGDGSKRRIGYGFGQWFVGRQLEEHIQRFRRVDIITQGDSLSIEDTAQFRNWYVEGRRGLAKSTCVWVLR